MATCRDERLRHPAGGLEERRAERHAPGRALSGPSTTRLRRRSGRRGTRATRWPRGTATDASARRCLPLRLDGAWRSTCPHRWRHPRRCVADPHPSRAADPDDAPPAGDSRERGNVSPRCTRARPRSTGGSDSVSPPTPSRRRRHAATAKPWRTPRQARCDCSRHTEVLDVVPDLRPRRPLAGRLISRPAWMWTRILKEATKPDRRAVRQGFVRRRALRPTAQTMVTCSTTSTGTSRSPRTRPASARSTTCGGRHRLSRLELWRYLLDIDLITDMESDVVPVDEPVRRAMHDSRAVREPSAHRRPVGPHPRCRRRVRRTHLRSGDRPVSDRSPRPDVRRQHRRPGRLGTGADRSTRPADIRSTSPPCPPPTSARFMARPRRRSVPSRER